MSQVRHIAIWSGPRNISTAMMRSWGNRADTFICDEPLYAHYLLKSGADHPGRDEVIAAHETDWRKVVAWLTGPVPENRAIFYQKHMSHHLLPEIERHWLAKLTHAFLIRAPREMLTSLIRNVPKPTLADTGLPQQIEIIELVRERTGYTPPIVDARDVLENPKRMLGLLCDALNVPFDDRMLSWPAGRRSTDGVWAKYWYDAVEKTTSFGRYKPKDEQVPDELSGVLAECERCYAEMYERRIR